jgi:hypothetical protein
VLDVRVVLDRALDTIADLAHRPEPTPAASPTHGSGG